MITHQKKHFRCARSEDGLMQVETRWLFLREFNNEGFSSVAEMKLLLSYAWWLMLLTLTSFLLPLWVNCFIRQWLNFFAHFDRIIGCEKNHPLSQPGLVSLLLIADYTTVPTELSLRVAPPYTRLSSVLMCDEYFPHISLSPHTLALCVSFHLWVRWVIHTHCPPQIDIKWWRSHLPFALFARCVVCLLVEKQMR